jgi:hypothetical protein
VLLQPMIRFGQAVGSVPVEPPDTWPLPFALPPAATAAAFKSRPYPFEFAGASSGNSHGAEGS